MLIRDNNEEALFLGFKDAEEMFLYRDVCGYEIVPTGGDDDELYNLEALEYSGKTKNDFVQYIMDNDLIDLFNYVKDLSLYDRFIYLFNFYYNQLLLTEGLMCYYNKNLEEAREFFNGELEVEFEEKYKAICLYSYEYTSIKFYLQRSALDRLDKIDADKFFKYTDRLDQHLNDLTNTGYQKRY